MTPPLPSAPSAPAVRPPLPLDPIRVASVPASHVYVRHLADPDGDDGVVRLPDIPPADGRTVPGGWWPPAMLDAEWIRTHHGDFDVFHVHFGFDAQTPDDLRGVVDALDDAGVPLVLTVHDLRNPHHRSNDAHDAQLAVLVAGATRLITLTEGAADAVQARFGRRPAVLPHPHVVPASRLRAPRPVRDGFVVGVHAKSLRANMDVLGVVRALAAATASLPGARVRVDLHDEVSDPASHWYDPRTAARLRALDARHAHVDLVEHGYFGDDELWDYLAALDASVLPYRFGTHSGWLEACHDLGTTVIAPTCGFYAQQRPVLPFDLDEDHGLDVASLERAVHRAYHQRATRRADPDARLAERRALAAAHRALYVEALRA